MEDLCLSFDNVNTCMVDSQLRLHRFILCTMHSEGAAREGGGAAREGGGATSQLDVLSLMLLSVAGCGQLQLRVPHWATSVDYCK